MTVTSKLTLHQYLAGSALFALLKPKIKMELKCNRLVVVLPFLLTQLMVPNGYVAQHASVNSISHVLQLEPKNQRPKLTVEAASFAPSMAAESDKRYTYFRYTYQYTYRYTPKSFFRMGPKTKTTPKVKPKYHKRSPKSSHAREKIAEFTTEQLMEAKSLWEEQLQKPKKERLSLRAISRMTGISLGTLNKRTTGKLPWTRNVGGKRTPRILTAGKKMYRLICIACFVSLDGCGF